MNKLLITVSIISILSGCATQAPVEAPKPRPVVVDNSMKELTDVARQAGEAQTRIAFAKQAVAASQGTEAGFAVAKASAEAVPVGWGQRATFDYEGPFNRLVEQITRDAGYRYFVTGKMPANAPIAAVAANDEMLIDILRDVTAQLPDNIKVHLHQTTKTIVVEVGGN